MLMCRRSTYPCRRSAAEYALMRRHTAETLAGPTVRTSQPYQMCQPLAAVVLRLDVELLTSDAHEAIISHI